VATDVEAAIWDAVSGRRLVKLVAPGSNRMQEIAWRPDGERIVTGADDGILRFWRASDGRLLVSLCMVAGSAECLLVTPDRRLDGSPTAISRLVWWRVGDRVARGESTTRGHRVPGLWRSSSVSGPWETPATPRGQELK
jgi:WD40 repeat protein